MQLKNFSDEDLFEATEKCLERNAEDCLNLIEEGLRRKSSKQDITYYALCLKKLKSIHFLFALYLSKVLFEINDDRVYEEIFIEGYFNPLRDLIQRILSKYVPYSVTCIVIVHNRLFVDAFELKHIVATIISFFFVVLLFLLREKHIRVLADAFVIMVVRLYDCRYHLLKSQIND